MAKLASWYPSQTVEVAFDIKLGICSNSVENHVALYDFYNYVLRRLCFCSRFSLVWTWLETDTAPALPVLWKRNDSILPPRAATIDSFLPTRPWLLRTGSAAESPYLITWSRKCGIIRSDAWKKNQIIYPAYFPSFCWTPSRLDSATDWIIKGFAPGFH